MSFERSRAELMVKVTSKIHWKYVIMIIQGMPLIYMKMQKLLYGLIHSELLLYRKLLKEIE